MRLHLSVLSFITVVSIAQAGDTTTDYSKQMTTPATEIKYGRGFYGAIFGGGNVYQNATFDNASVRAFENRYGVDANLGHDAGWFAGAKLGYVFDTHTWFLPAAELEGFYNTVDIKANASSSAFDADAHVKAQMRSGVFMLNLLGKIDLGRFQPYFGGGIGGTYIDAGRVEGELDVAGHDVVNFNGDASELGRVGHFRTSTWDLAWQAIGGADYYLTPRVSVFVEYKALWYYVNTDGVSNYLQQLVGGGVRLHF